MTKITLLEFFLLSMASFRLTRLVVYDKITEFIRSPFYDEVEEVNEAGETEVYYVAKKQPVLYFFGELLSCYWCTGIWASAILMLIYLFWPSIGFPIVLLLAIAGLGAIVETLVQKWLSD